DAEVRLAGARRIFHAAGRIRRAVAVDVALTRVFAERPARDGTPVGDDLVHVQTPERLVDPIHAEVEALLVLPGVRVRHQRQVRRRLHAGVGAERAPDGAGGVRGAPEEAGRSRRRLRVETA